MIRDTLRAIEGDDLRSVRDRALPSFGMATCMRRAGVVVLELADIERVKGGMRFTIRRSKVSLR